MVSEQASERASLLSGYLGEGREREKERERGREGGKERVCMHASLACRWLLSFGPEVALVVR